MPYIGPKVNTAKVPQLTLLATGEKHQPAYDVDAALYSEMASYQPPMDPRPDLFIDSDLWHRFLTALWLLDDSGAEDSLFWCLETTRCLGASLTITDGKARVRRGQMSEDEYEQVRRDWLLPRIDKLRPFLEDPGKWTKW